MNILTLPEILSADEIQEWHKLIGQNIKRLRIERGVSQLEMALSIGQKAVSFYVNAENCARNKRFNIEHLLKIAKVLNVDICEFFKLMKKD